MAVEIDPITLQVIGGALHSIAEQMGNVLYRMSYSSIIRESQDLGAGLFDRDYNTLCESDSTPMHIGSLPGYLRGNEKTIQLDAWKPGDCVIHNHARADYGVVLSAVNDGYGWALDTEATRAVRADMAGSQAANGTALGMVPAGISFAGVASAEDTENRKRA